MTQQITEIAFLLFAAGLSVSCFMLSRRLRKMNDLESGLGGAIAVMISEVDRLEKAIQAARAEAARATGDLAAEIERAKQERASWVVQQQFMRAAKRDLPAIQRRRYRKRAEVENA